MIAWVVWWILVMLIGMPSMWIENANNQWILQEVQLEGLVTDDIVEEEFGVQSVCESWSICYNDGDCGYWSCNDNKIEKKTEYSCWVVGTENEILNNLCNALMCEEWSNQVKTEWWRLISDVNVNCARDKDSGQCSLNSDRWQGKYGISLEDYGAFNEFNESMWDDSQTWEMNFVILVNQILSVVDHNRTYYYGMEYCNSLSKDLCSWNDENINWMHNIQCEMESVDTYTRYGYCSCTTGRCNLETLACELSDNEDLPSCDNNDDCKQFGGTNTWKGK